MTSTATLKATKTDLDRRRRPHPSHRPRSRRPHPTAPDPRRLVEAVVRAYVEVEAGLRPLSQLLPVLAPALAIRLLARPSRRPEGDAAPDAVLSVHHSPTGPDALNATAVVRWGGRVGAIAVRAERFRGAWRIVTLDRPEHQS